MANGKPGDHPFTDITVHGRNVYSRRAAELVREIARLSDEKTRRQLAALLLHEYNEFNRPDVAKLRPFSRKYATSFCGTQRSVVSS